ncbi:hypothetical protein FEM33_21670 [Dyadobacter flavalbus]|uniref:Uncharacterized protein n=1 Tax=Dyadobacter flavalbus TaxID=2579942 RepID=A0A5M8QKP1_9BACT|nr:hypothetical protein [Dyadobacter flavalbus]KAA6436747.1 hypothetical protein FEM33_21670 [Dyadobacter flavalbus]
MPLLRRFIRSSCNKDEAAQLIKILRSPEGQLLYGELMDETLACNEIEDVLLTDEQIEMSFCKLENRIDNMIELAWI